VIDKITDLLKTAAGSLGINEELAFKVEIPPRKDLGDYSSNIAILLARKLSQKPLELAKTLSEKVKAQDLDNVFQDIGVATPGFINFKLSEEYLIKQTKDILALKESWGNSSFGAGKRVLLEFVSANPTGPLHVGHGRWAVIGDVIARLLRKTGFSVDTEFYVNNIGNQVDKLYASVIARREGKDIPEDGYGGAYVMDVKGKTIEEMIDFLLNEQKETLNALGVSFNKYFLESALHADGEVAGAVKKVEELGKSFVEGGAVWFKSQELGDDKNRVLVREDGNPTYFAADIAYHLNKFSRGYDYLINIWGTDHHGYVKRLKSSLAALGQPVEKFEVIIGQLVSLYRGEEQIRMSKRTGEMITLKELVDETGSDATRFFFAATDVNSHLDFDMELAKKHSSDNPVFYLQYAHARICSILRKSQNPNPESQIIPNIQSPIEKAERDLMLKIIEWPDVVENAARLRHPHMLTEYGKELAITFHHFYEKCRVIGNPFRIMLSDASRITLSNMLLLLGVSAPESM